MHICVSLLVINHFIGIIYRIILGNNSVARECFIQNLYGANPNTNIDGMRTAKELGLATKDADATEIITRAQAVSIIHAALTNTKTAQEPSIVTEMKGVVKDLPQSATNDFYADMAKVPEPIRKAFITDGWKICCGTRWPWTGFCIWRFP